MRAVALSEPTHPLCGCVHLISQLRWQSTRRARGNPFATFGDISLIKGKADPLTRYAGAPKLSVNYVDISLALQGSVPPRGEPFLALFGYE